ncbi:hypothetical protein AB1Y20_017014 [Prymnesium parvum]|uniref:Amino acid transporter transmembrane domain-containing protein n=1 Tax=Prymnesium parvum TaxID=97485 RepID=A0AB34IB78_PRYPA
MPTGGVMASIFGVTQYHPDHGTGALGKFRASPAGRLFNGAVLILAYLLFLLGPCAAIHYGVSLSGAASQTAVPTPVSCKWSFPLQCLPAAACERKGLRCAARA